MDLLYATSGIPDHVKGGIIMFNLKDRVMSRIKSKVWKTLSHTGVLYQSLVSGKPKTWVIYMDEIYGIVSCPLDEFLFINSIAGADIRPWAIRYIDNFDHTTSAALNAALAKHSQEDSNLGLDEDNRITGSFDDELRSILGLPRAHEDEDDLTRTNTNLGFVFDVLQDFWRSLKISETKLGRESSIGFSEDEIIEDDLLRSFYNGKNLSNTDGLMKTVHQLLSMVNLTTHTINPPIQPLLTKPLPCFSNTLVVPTDTFYSGPGRRLNHLAYPRIAEDRQHVATVIASMFESGIGTEGVREFFEEEIDTTTLARRGRNELTVDLTRDLARSVIKHLEYTRGLLINSPKAVRETYNATIYDIIVAQGSLMTHLGVGDVNIAVDRLKL